MKNASSFDHFCMQNDYRTKIDLQNGEQFEMFSLERKFKSSKYKWPCVDKTIYLKILGIYRYASALVSRWNNTECGILSLHNTSSPTIMRYVSLTMGQKKIFWGAE